MVRGSQLQVAKLAQMCPAGPSSIQQHPAVPSDGQQCSAAASGAQRQQAVLSRVYQWPAETGVKTRAKTRMEHLGAPNVLLKN